MAISVEAAVKTLALGMRGAGHRPKADVIRREASWAVVRIIVEPADPG